MAKKIQVIKHDGNRENYNQEKVLKSILRSHIDEDQALEILARVEENLFDGMTTRELYQMVNREIVRQEIPHGSSLYRLREAIAAMNSIDFEKFINELLIKEGFHSAWNSQVKGYCIEHQLDVIATDNQKKVYYVEIKHHRQYHRDSDLGTVIELWGRFEDLRKGFENKDHEHDFAAAWLITNTKFSWHAKKYAKCKNLMLTGWHYRLDQQGKANKKSGLEKDFENLGPSQVMALVKKVIDGV